MSNSILVKLCLRVACRGSCRSGAIGDKTKTSQIINHYQQVRHIRLCQERTVRSMYWRGRSFDKLVLPPSRRNQMIDWNYRSEIFAFSRRLQENLSEDTLRQVFAHPSYIQNFKENQERYNLPQLNLKSNVELVEKGKTVLADSLRPYLRYTFNRLPEDGIIQISKYLESDEILADVANSIGCKEVILSNEYPPTEVMMADTVRAFIGGIASEFDFGRARRFVVDIIVSYLNDKDILDDVWIIPNPMETLNFILSNSKLPPYEPRIMFQTGVDTLEPCHIVGLYVNKKLIGSSPGETLQIAEHCAALDSLQRLFDLRENRATFTYGEAAEKVDYNPHLKEHDYIKTWQSSLD